MSSDVYTPEPYDGSVNFLEEMGCLDEDGNIIEDACPWLDEEE